MQWSTGEIGPDLDGYNMWEMDTAQALWPGDVFMPVFIELAPDKTATTADAIDGLLALNAAETAAFTLSPT